MLVVVGQITIVDSTTEEITIVRDDGGAFPLQGRVPVILNGVVGAAIKESSDRGPLISKPRVGPDYGLVFLRGEGSVLHLGRQLVTPSQPARLAGSTRNRLADQRPVPWSMLLHQPL